MLQPESTLWLSQNNEKLFSEQSIALLLKIKELASLSKAAKAVGLSYKAAWDAIARINNLSDSPVISTAIGGSGGGGTTLTEYGEKILTFYTRLTRYHDAFLSDIRNLFTQQDIEKIYPTIRRLTMKTSARNQLAGTVIGIKNDHINTEVDLQLASGDRLHAIITRQSALDLGIEVNRDVFALIKASWIILAVPENSVYPKLSARNQLAGTIAKLDHSAVESEVTLTLKGGTTLTAIITRSSEEGLKLRIGMEVMAVIKASHIILGVI